MADESITFELGRHVSDIVGLIERNTCQCDFIQFRLDWLYNAVVRYCDNIPSGEAVMALIQEATELLRQSEGEGLSQNLSFQAEFTATGERGRPRSPVETELHKIAPTSISFNQTDYVTYVPTQFESDRLVRHFSSSLLFGLRSRHDCGNTTISFVLLSVGTI